MNKEKEKNRIVSDPLVQSIVKKSGTLKREIRRETARYILAGFGFVAGLAWNEAIRGLIEAVFPATSDTVLAKFLYAAGVTLVVVFVTVHLNRAAKE